VREEVRGKPTMATSKRRPRTHLTLDTLTLHRLYAFFVIEHATAGYTSSGSPPTPPAPG
jgi:hypothetical protein